MSTEIAIEWNQIVLSELLAAVPNGNNFNYGVGAPDGYTVEGWANYLSFYLQGASNAIFKKRQGDMTHIIAGPDAYLGLMAPFRAAAIPNGTNPQMYAGLVLTPFADGQMQNVRCYKTNLWAGRNKNKILVIRRGDSWSDTPHVWAPYATYTSPVLTLPDTFTQKQGIMDRVAHQVVIPDAIASVTVVGGTGAPLTPPTTSS